MTHKPPFQDWKFAHFATIFTVIAISAAYFIFTSDANLLVAGAAIVIAGLLAILGAQIHVWSAARHRRS